MEVILLERMKHLGSLGDKVKVKAGYARNYLVPQSKAVYATASNLARFEAMRAELEKKLAEQTAAAEQRAQSVLAAGDIQFVMKASEEGKLFGSITVRDILNHFSKANVTVEKSEIFLPQGALRQVGEHVVKVDLGYDISVDVKVLISAQ